MFDIVNFTLASSLATSGTVTVSYPSGRSKGNYSGNDAKHVLIAGQNEYVSPKDFSLTFNANASSITLTWAASITLPAGTACKLQMERRGPDSFGTVVPADVVGMTRSTVYAVDLGSPNVSDDDGVRTASSVSGSGALTLNGALVSSSVAYFDVPRNVIITSSGNDSGITFTVTGKDKYNNTVVETITGANAGIASGLKAFATVTGVTASGASAGTVKIGTGDVLGLPVFLPSAGYILKELQDGTSATAGTTVAGVVTKATATTGDVRGTYDPNAACDGSKGFVLLIALTDPDNKGVPQYAG